jgi:hypothetical protein
MLSRVPRTNPVEDAKSGKFFPIRRQPPEKMKNLLSDHG